MGILQLYKPIEKGRAESVSAYALAVGALNSNSVASILSSNLDLAASAQEDAGESLRKRRAPALDA